MFPLQNTPLSQHTHTHTQILSGIKLISWHGAGLTDLSGFLRLDFSFAYDFGFLFGFLFCLGLFLKKEEGVKVISF